MDNVVRDQEVGSARAESSPGISDVRALDPASTGRVADPQPVVGELGSDEANVLLRGGAVDYWNRWRKLSAKPPSLMGSDLRGAQLEGADLAGLDLRGADLSGAKLTRANLTDANLTDANLSHVEAAKASFVAARLINADLTDSACSYADFSGSKLLGTQFSQARLTGARLHSVRAEGARFEDANLVNADLSGAVLDWADFTRCDLRSAILEGTKLDATNFSLANLAGARIDERRFDRVLGLVESTSGSARNATVAMLAACAYSLLSSMSVRRAVLISDTGSFKLPLLDVETSARLFFVCAPLACLLGFAYLQFYLYHVLRLMLRLPVRFVDGMTLSEKTYPWPFNMLLERRLGAKTLGQEEILVRRERGFRSARLMTNVGMFATSFVTWCLVPVTIAALTVRVIGMQRWVDSLIAVLSFWFSLLLAFALRHRESCLIASYAKSRAPKPIGGALLVGLAGGLALSLVLSIPPVSGRLSVPDLENENLKGANLEGALLRGANLRSANIESARMQHGDFQHAKFYAATLSNAYAPGAHFYCSILENAKLDGLVATQADFRRAVLRGADLRGARLQGAWLEGADLSETDLEQADLSGVRCDARTRWPSGKVPPGVRCSNATDNTTQTCSAQAERWTWRED